VDVGLKGGRDRDKEEAKHARTNKESTLGIAHSGGIQACRARGASQLLKSPHFPIFGAFLLFLDFTSVPLEESEINAKTKWSTH
jgi:hypothetical protein